MKKKKRYPNPKPVQCPNNEGVACLKPNACDACGWNPKVSHDRAMRMKLIKNMKLC